MSGGKRPNKLAGKRNPNEVLEVLNTACCCRRMLHFAKDRNIEITNASNIGLTDHGEGLEHCTEKNNRLPNKNNYSNNMQAIHNKQESK